MLMRHVPEAVGNGIRAQHVLRLQLRAKLVNERHVDRAVDVDVRDMHAVRSEIARHHLR
jgi:hypothetical protein